jgi:hypothetical protein
MSSPVSFPVCSSYGTSGRPIVVASNHYLFKKLPKNLVYHYNVSIQPEKSAKFRAVFEQFKLQSSDLVRGVGLVYDGMSNIYANKAFIPGGALKTKVTLPAKSDSRSDRLPRTFDFTIRQVARVNMFNIKAVQDGILTRKEDALRPISIIESIIHQAAIDHGFMVIDSSFYSGNVIRPISSGLEAWTGHYTSVHATEKGLCLNIDTTVTAFYQSIPLIEMISKVLNLRDPRDLEKAITMKHNQDLLRKPLTHLRVKVDYVTDKERAYTIAKLGTLPASKHMFTIGDTKQEISVADYLRQRYNVRLKYPQLPCVLTQRGDALPIEVCTILPNQKYKGQPDERALADLIKVAAARPDIRRKDTEAGFQMLQLNQSPLMKSYGIEIDTNMVKVKARILDSPTLLMNSRNQNANTLNPTFGSWNMKDSRVASGATLNSFSIVALGDRHTIPEQTVRKFFGFMLQEFVKCGLNVPVRDTPIYYAPIQCNIEETLIKAEALATKIFRAKPQIIFVTYPRYSNIYSEIKYVAETKLGLMTQVILSRKMDRPSPQVIRFA